MKCKYLAIYLLITPLVAWGNSISLDIRGQVEVSESCLEGKTMVWLSAVHEQDEHLLYHVSVPNRGSYSFSVRPGDYILRATTAKNCEWEQNLNVVENYFQKIVIKEKQR